MIYHTIIHLYKPAYRYPKRGRIVLLYHPILYIPKGWLAFISFNDRPALYAPSFFVSTTQHGRATISFISFIPDPQSLITSRICLTFSSTEQREHIFVSYFIAVTNCHVGSRRVSSRCFSVVILLYHVLSRIYIVPIIAKFPF